MSRTTIRRKGKKECRDEFFKRFYPEFFTQLQRGSKWFEIFGNRPQERWLYGFIVQALSEVLKDEKEPVVLTEVPVARVQNESKKGRIDLIFQFKEYLFMVEIKALACDLSRIATNGPPKKLIESWVESKEQLKGINLSDERNSHLRSLPEKKIKFAMLLVTCGETGKGKGKLNSIAPYKKDELDNLKRKIKKELNAELAEADTIDNSGAFLHISGEKYRREFGWLLFAGEPY